MKQLSIDFNPSITKTYSNCTDYVAARVHQQGVPQKTIAMDMDLAPSQLSQKLGNNNSSSARFTLNDLENFMKITGDIEPIKYLIAKYMHSATSEELKQQILELQNRLNGVEDAE